LANPRIISGSARGTRLIGIPGRTTRPITDRTKEALFNIIGQDIFNSSMLDLFGGTGSVGIEALSRGANYVRFVEINPKVFDVIRKNLEKTHLSNRADVICMDAFKYLKEKMYKTFDYIFIAPPQYQNLWAETLNILDMYPGHLDKYGWLIVQIDPLEYTHINPRHYNLFDQRKYGSTLLLFFDKK